MISEKELAITRIALRYYCEEFEPHGNSFESYVSEEDRKYVIQNSDLRRTLEKFGSVNIRQVMFDSESNRLVSKQHFASVDAASVPTPAKRISYVAILIPAVAG